MKFKSPKNPDEYIDSLLNDVDLLERTNKGLKAKYEAMRSLAEELAGALVSDHRGCPNFPGKGCQAIAKYESVKGGGGQEPYPTVWAYEQSCRAREKFRAALERIVREPLSMPYDAKLNEHGEWNWLFIAKEALKGRGE